MVSTLFFIRRARVSPIANDDYDDYDDDDDGGGDGDAECEREIERAIAGCDCVGLCASAKYLFDSRLQFYPS